MPLAGELHGLARRAFAGQAAEGHTLQPTALLHEAWIKEDRRYKAPHVPGSAP